MSTEKFGFCYHCGQETIFDVTGACELCELERALERVRARIAEGPRARRVIDVKSEYL